MTANDLQAIFRGLPNLEAIAIQQGRWKNAPWKTWWRRWSSVPVMVYDLGDGWSMAPRRRVIGRGPAFDFLLDGQKVMAINQSQGEITREIFPQVVVLMYGDSKKHLNVIETPEDVERLRDDTAKALINRLALRIQERS